MGFAEGGPQIEGFAYGGRERPDSFRVRAHVCAGAMARGQQGLRYELFVSVEDRVAGDSECACERACGGKARTCG